MIRTKTYAGSDAGLGVNSHLLLGEREVMLVDTQFLISEARNVIDTIKTTGKRLTTIFVTHEHPDHHFGTQTIKSAFPDARVLARPPTVDAIDKTAEAKMAQWRPVYGADVPTSYERPEAYGAPTLSFEGHEIELIDLGAGESDTGTVLHLKEDKLLLSADFVYSDVFAWLVANHPDAWAKVLSRLDALRDVETVLPGHGPSGNRSLIRAMSEYLKTFADVVASTNDPASAKADLRRRYPGHRLAIMMEMSVDDAFVATGDGGNHFRQNHRSPGAHPLARRRISAPPAPRRSRVRPDARGAPEWKVLSGEGGAVDHGRGMRNPFSSTKCSARSVSLSAMT